jgi:DNA-binding MarR family transcriptional regulator
MPSKGPPARGAAAKNTNTKNATGQKAGQELAKVDFGRLPGYIGYQVRQAQSAVFRDLSRTLGKTGVTPGEFSLLTMLRANPGINSITLTRIYQLDKATLSLSIKRLAKRGLISSTRHANDRRYYALELTSEGRVLLQGVTRRIEKQERTMDAVLKPGERGRLLDLLQRISRAFNR